jgi:Cytochrome c1
MRKILVLGLAFSASLVSFEVPAQNKTVLDGVYSKAQAQRGARTYRNICAHCHEGGEPDAEPLIGPDFIERWREAPLSFLHGFFSREMPGDEPGSLKPQVYLETLAFLLQENGYPAGAELKEDALSDIWLVGPDGAKPLPANALVRVVGCLATDKLSLERGSLPERVRRADSTHAEELAQAAQLSLGEARYALRGEAAQSAIAAGSKVQVKGVWVPSGSEVTLTVLSLAETGAACN